MITEVSAAQGGQPRQQYGPSPTTSNARATTTPASVAHRHMTPSPQAFSASYGVYSAIQQSSQGQYDASPPSSRVATRHHRHACPRDIHPTHPTNKPTCLSSHLSSALFDIYSATNHNYERMKRNKTRKTSHHAHQIKSTSNTRQTRTRPKSQPTENLYGYDYRESSHRVGRPPESINRNENSQDRTTSEREIDFRGKLRGNRHSNV